jgi:transcriptional regulator with XRE-family HTH domain
MAAEVRLRVGQWRKFCRMRGWESENQQAHGLGVSPSTINRILKGTQRPSGEFIGAALLAFPELEFIDLFEVIASASDEAVPA